MIDSIVKVVRGIIKLRGGSDNTIIGNVTDSLKTNVTNVAQKTMANSIPVVIASDQTTIPINDNNSSLTVDTPQLPSTLGQKTPANSLAVIEPSVGSNATTIPTYSTLIAGADASSILRPLLTDDQGRLVTSATGYNSNFSFGDITTAAITTVPIRRTTYNEQTVNGQRSIASTSALDIAGGTGARQLVITYFDATGAGPFSETITLNGTAGVNTVATNICYIEKIQISSVGSGGVNAGVITLYTAVAKGGTVIGTISATDNQTFWAHHYVATGKSCNITGFSNSHSGTTVGSGGVFILKAKIIGSTTAPELQVSDFNRLYGQDSANPRNYGSPIKVTGPSRIIAYVTPETTTSTIYRAAIDFFEQ